MSETDPRNQPCVPAQALESLGSSIVWSTIGIPNVTFDTERIDKNLAEAIETWQIIRDPKTDKPFEVAIINADSTSDNVTVFSSTYRSSISNNPGNLVEFAQSAAARPTDEKRVYVAALGNGGSAYLDTPERKYFRKTGRLTHDNNGTPTALETVQALSRALRAHDLYPNRFSADSAGCSLSTALMATLPEGSVKHAYFKGRTNLAGQTIGQLVRGMFYTEQFKHQPANMELTRDASRLTKERVDAAIQLADRIYNDHSQNIYDNKLPAIGRESKKLINDMLAYRHGLATGDPAVLDTRAALRTQPEAQFTFHCSEQDPLYGNGAEDTGRVVRDFVSRLAVGHLVECLIVPGTHSDHAAFPGLRAGAENYAFSK